MESLNTLLRGGAGQLQSSTGIAAPRIIVRNLTRAVVVGDLIDVANVGPRRRKGLLGRTSLASGEGLWIVPCEAVHTFFMRCALDLIYLNRRYQVVKAETGVVPWRISLCMRAHSILELPIGTISSTGTRVGDCLSILPVSENY